MPAFPADLSTKEAASARLIMYYQYISICRGEKSIFAKLKKANINPDDYIRFYSLRSYDRIHRRKLEEMLARAAGYSANVTEGEVESVRVATGQDAVQAEHTAEVYDADRCIAEDSIARDAMKSGRDVRDEPWLADTTDRQPRGDAAEKLEREGYVSEETYIHAKLLIADGTSNSMLV